jgi:hypothetical protein
MPLPPGGGSSVDGGNNNHGGLESNHASIRSDDATAVSEITVIGKRQTPLFQQTGLLPTSPLTTICQRRDWHDLQLAGQVGVLRAAGFLVAVGVAIRQLRPDNTSGYAVADYIATEPDSNVYVIGEVKTGNAGLTGPQRRNYRTGMIQIIGNGGLPVGLPSGVIIPAIYEGVDRFPGCPG